MHDGPQVDLKADQLEIVKTILAKYIAGAKVYAFGSRVKGNARPYSDLDLLIVDKTALRLETISALKEAFEESKLPFKVDIVEWVSISSNFQKIIEQDCVRLQ